MLDGWENLTHESHKQQLGEPQNTASAEKRKTEEKTDNSDL